MKRIFYSLLISVTFFCVANAQVGLQLEKKTPSLDRSNMVPPSIIQNNLPDLETLILNPTSLENYKAYNYHSLAFFCKVEVQLEKKTKIPVKFRLGDVRYVDWLEGKIDSY